MTVPVWRWRCSQRVSTLNGAVLCDPCLVSLVSFRPPNSYGPGLALAALLGGRESE